MLLPYHVAWLQVHPDRSREWLQKMLAEGFDVHHVDLDRTNNDPANLVLIEHIDHMRFHGLFKFVRPNRTEASRSAGKARWEGKSAEEKSKHCRMMVMVRVKKDRLRLRLRRLREAKEANLAGRATSAMPS